jgi:hypothetical protein
LERTKQCAAVPFPLLLCYYGKRCKGIYTADVAQSVRAPDCGPGGRGFNSRHSPHDAYI